jgi:chitinase
VGVRGLANGFRITAPADTSNRTLKVYLGLYGATGRFQAYLSDHSAPAYIDSSLSSIYGNPAAVYILDYKAASPGQTLVVEYTAGTLFDVDYGYVSLHAATLSGASLSTNAPPIVVVSSTSEGAAYTAPADITITATASDSDGSIRKVEFFQDATKLGETTNAPYSIVWSKVAAGAYSITARATDDAGAVATSTPINVTVNGTPPVPLACLDTLVSGNRFRFAFTTESNKTYLVESTASLNPVYWQTLTNLVGDGGVFTVSDSVQTAPQQFYRVKAQ